MKPKQEKLIDGIVEAVGELFYFLMSIDKVEEIYQGNVEGGLLT